MSFGLEFGPHMCQFTKARKVPQTVATDTLETSIRSTGQPNAAYAGRSVAIAAHMRQLGRRSRVTPEKVARTAVAVVGAERPALRYAVGGQARFIPWLKAVLPQSWFESFMMRQFTR